MNWSKISPLYKIYSGSSMGWAGGLSPTFLKVLGQSPPSTFVLLRCKDVVQISVISKLSSKVSSSWSTKLSKLRLLPLLIISKVSYCMVTTKKELNNYYD